MHLLHSIVFVEVHLLCYLHPTYIDTKASHLADSLSHNNVHLFLSKILSDNAHPAVVSTLLLDLLLDLQADWTSPIWCHYFRNIIFSAGLVPSTQKTEFTLCYYASYLAEKGLAPQHTWPLCRMPRFQWDSQTHGSTRSYPCSNGSKLVQAAAGEAVFLHKIPDHNAHLREDERGLSGFLRYEQGGSVGSRVYCFGFFLLGELLPEY